MIYYPHAFNDCYLNSFAMIISCLARMFGSIRLRLIRLSLPLRLGGSRLKCMKLNLSDMRLDR